MNNILSVEIRNEIDKFSKHYPDNHKQSVIITALRLAQHNHGYLTEDLINAVAQYIGIPAITVYEVASFYSLFENNPIGRHSISICTNISCMLRDSNKILQYVESKLGINLGESTPDGKFYLKCEEECLASCSTAPVMQINHVYYENLTKEKVDEVLDNLE